MVSSNQFNKRSIYNSISVVKSDKQERSRIVQFKSNLWHIGAWDVAKMRKTARTVPGCLMSEKGHYLNAQCDRTRLK